jgi:hypothetical protein
VVRFACAELVNQGEFSPGFARDRSAAGIGTSFAYMATIVSIQTNFFAGQNRSSIDRATVRFPTGIVAVPNAPQGAFYVSSRM